MSEKQTDPSWEEFEKGLGDAIKGINKSKYHRYMHHQSEYDRIKNLPYRESDYPYIKSHCRYLYCNNCNKTATGKYCGHCRSITKEYRSWSICNDCKTVFYDKYCPDCGKGEHWDREEYERKLPTKIKYGLVSLEQAIINAKKRATY